MRLLFITLSLLFPYLSVAQTKPTLGMFWGGLIESFSEFQLNGGVSLNPHFDVLLNYRMLRGGTNSLSLIESKPMKLDFLSITSSYRVLNENYLVSPKITADIGIPIRSNADGAVIYRSSVINEYKEGAWKHNKSLVWGKVKALCDIRFKNFNFMLGASYSIWRIDYSSLKAGYSNSLGYIESDTKKYNEQIFGFEVGLMYTLPHTKQKQE